MTDAIVIEDFLLKFENLNHGTNHVCEYGL